MPDHDESALALLHLARLRAEGGLTDAQYENAQQGLHPPLQSQDDAPIEPTEGGPVDDFKDYDYETELPGNKGLRSFHKALAAAGKACKKALTSLEEPDVRAHLGEHEAGIAKALKAMGQLHGKKYKGTPPLPEDYPDEEESPVVSKGNFQGSHGDFDDPETPLPEDLEGKAVDGAMSAQDATAGGSVLGVRPEDEDAADEMDDDTFRDMKKSLPALRRQLGLR